MRVLVYEVECCNTKSEIWGDEYHGIVQYPRYLCIRCGCEPRITWSAWRPETPKSLNNLNPTLF